MATRQPEVAEEGRSGATSATRWLLSAPALVIIFFAAIGPLLIVLVYSFLTPGPYGDVKSGSSRPRPGYRCSSSATSSTTRCRSPTAHVTIFWRSVKLAW